MTSNWEVKCLLEVWAIQFSHSVMSDSLRPHGLQHSRPPCPSPTSRACSDSCLLSQWCHPTIHLLLSPSPPAFNLSQYPGSFTMSLFFASCGPSIGASPSALVFPMNIQNWFPLGLTGLISCSPTDSQESSPTPQFESINSSVLSFLYGPALTSIHDYWKNHSFD